MHDGLALVSSRLRLPEFASRACGQRPSPFGVAEGGLSPLGPKGIVVGARVRQAGDLPSRGTGSTGSGSPAAQDIALRGIGKALLPEVLARVHEQMADFPERPGF